MCGLYRDLQGEARLEGAVHWPSKHGEGNFSTNILSIATANSDPQDGSQEINTLVSEYGQILVVVSLSSSPLIDTTYAAEIAQGLLQSCGQLFAFIRQISFSDGSFRAIAQYCKPAAAIVALKICHGLSFEVHSDILPLKSSFLT